MTKEIEAEGGGVDKIIYKTFKSIFRKLLREYLEAGDGERFTINNHLLEQLEKYEKDIGVSRIEVILDYTIYDR